MTKSERTRQRIAEAARDLFLRQGYGNTSVRDIAERAECDPALIIRYFGSKDRLFAAMAVFDLRLPRLADVDPRRRGETLAAHFLDLWEPGGNPSGLVILLRSSTSSTAAMDRMREVFLTQVAPSLTRDAGVTEVQAAIIAAQILGIALSRYILELPPVSALTRPEFTAAVGKSLQALIDAGQAETEPRTRP